MFGHQDDQHHHHDDDNKPMNDVIAAPAVDSVLSTDDHGGTTVHDDQSQGFNPTILEPASQDVTAPTPDAVEPVAAEPVAAPASSDLLSIKQQALTDLSPLVGHLDQSPEEKFRTTMMMIQASDNQALVGTAYEAAQAITDEKVKAQALLDIVNEINYFTQQSAATA